MTETLINLAGLDGIDRLLPKTRRMYYGTTETIIERNQRLFGRSVCN